MTKEMLLAEWGQTTNTLLDTLSRFTPEMFTAKPSDDEWSAAQIAEHLWKLDQSTTKTLTGPMEPTTSRTADEKIAMIKERMEASVKRIASEAMQPSNEGQNQAELLQRLQQQQQILKEAFLSTDGTETCTFLQHPVLGLMTKMEWLAFTMYHVQRHLKQLTQLEEKLTAQV